MSPIRIRMTVERDGEVTVTGLPCRRGQEVEILLTIEPPGTRTRSPLTAQSLLDSGIVGLWVDREDAASPDFARTLRERAQRRSSDS
jgi:hypothetical protein